MIDDVATWLDVCQDWAGRVGLRIRPLIYTAAMIELGRRWCEIIGPDPDTDPNAAGPSGTPDPSGTPSPSPLAASIGEVLGKVARAVAQEKVPTDPAEVAA